MEVVVTTGAIGRVKLHGNHHHQQTNTQPLLQARCPSCCPTNSVKALKGKVSHSMDSLIPSSPGVFQLCLWPQIDAGYLGVEWRGCHASHQPSDASTPNKIQNLFNIIIALQCSWHCWLGDKKGIWTVKKDWCWFVGADNWTGALHVL